MMYQVFLWIHIGSYICWLLAFAGSLFWAAKVRGTNEPALKRKHMNRERLAGNIGTHIGATGILISGGAMVSIPGGPQWGWFNLQLYPWLTVKQVIFIIILLLVVFSVKKSRAFKKTLKREEGISEAISEKWSAAYRLSLVIYMLVVINTFLGFSKPF